jgi:hypothetical protein
VKAAAAEVKLRAERKAGAMLAAMEKQSGARGVGKKVGSHDATPLSEFGIDKTQSSRWQREAGTSSNLEILPPGSAVGWRVLRR